MQTVPYYDEFIGPCNSVMGLIPNLEYEAIGAEVLQKAWNDKIFAFIALASAFHIGLRMIVHRTGEKISLMFNRRLAIPFVGLGPVHGAVYLKDLDVRWSRICRRVFALETVSISKVPLFRIPERALVEQVPIESDDDVTSLKKARPSLHSC